MGELAIVHVMHAPGPEARAGAKNGYTMIPGHPVQETGSHWLGRSSPDIGRSTSMGADIASDASRCTGAVRAGISIAHSAWLLPVLGERPLPISSTGSNGSGHDDHLSKFIAVKPPLEFRFPEAAFRR